MPGAGGTSWYFDGNTIYINGTSSPHGLPSFPITPIITPAAGGGSVTGTPSTNSLDNHFQNLLANPLYIFEEYLYNNDIYEGTFEFLNNAQKTILANRLYFIDLSNDFLLAHNNSSTAQVFISDMITQISLYNLLFLTAEDIQLLFEHPAIYTAYKQFLAQNPSATEEQKKAVLRMVAFAPSNQITNLQQRLNCFNTSPNSSYTHTVTLCVDQPVAGEDDSAVVKKQQGILFLLLSKVKEINLLRQDCRLVSTQLITLLLAVKLMPVLGMMMRAMILM